MRLRRSRARNTYRDGWVSVVDTGTDPARSRALRLAWAKTAIARLEGEAPGYSGYAVFSISRSDLRRLRDIQLLDLGVADGNALAASKDRTSE
jgi:hypothetical protein